MVLAIYCTGADAPRAERYASEEATKGLGNGFHVFVSMEKLAYSTKIATGLILEIYNSIVPDPAKKWINAPSREEAAQIFWDLCHEVLPISEGLRPTTGGDAASTEEDTMTTTETTAPAAGATTGKAKTAKKTTAKAPAKGKAATKAPAASAPPAQGTGRGAVVKKAPKVGNGRGRTSAHAGKKLHPVAAKCKKTDENKTGNPRREGSHGHKSMKIIIDNPGITFEDFIKKGGRAMDLDWDVSKGNATAK